MIPRDDQSPHVIDLNCEGQRAEGIAKASEDIKPGMLVDIDSSSTDLPRTPEVLKKHSVYGGNALLRVALADRLRDFTLEDTYEDGDTVPFVICEPGDVFLAMVADGYAGNPGDYLSSSGNGLFEAATGTEINVALAQVEDTVTYAGTSDSAPRFVRARAL